jgi:hypothetical protein
MRPTLPIGLATLAALSVAAAAGAQPLGTFRWQLQPYCNVVTVVVTQVGGVYRVEGTDDQCGASSRASVIGTAFQNPNGSIGLGLNIVAAPGGTAAPVDATIGLATLSGTWRDGAGLSGTFAFTPGASTGGGPRPAAAGAIPPVIQLRGDGGLLAGGQLDIGTIPATGAGTRMMWHPRKAAFRAGKVSAGQWDEAQVGFLSTAFGQNSQASGFAAVAMGNGAVAMGEDSVALGQFPSASGSGSVALNTATVASGPSAIATGYGTVASGARSTAMGQTTTASGGSATALGTGTTASGYASLAGGSFSAAIGTDSLAFGVGAEAGGVESVALGRGARTTTAAVGSFMFADRSSGDPFQSNAPNEFGARFAGGYYFYTRADLGTGVALAASGSSWAALSDVNAKANFREVDGEELLGKLARIPVREWNYKAQDPAIRHIGPTAQDFRAAFGVGDFPLRINTIDADGVALAGVQALDARTRALQAENEVLREAVAALRRDLDALARDGGWR